jgi:metal-dependent hydrolase (beta-lactamase superfamily II)
LRFFVHIGGTVLVAVPLFVGYAVVAEDHLDPPIDCRSCASWNEGQAPFRIFGNTYYVGTAGLAVILIDTGDGLILLDGALPQSVPLIASNMEALGFSLTDVRLVALSHAHYDHAGGIAALACARRLIWPQSFSRKSIIVVYRSC